MSTEPFKNKSNAIFKKHVSVGNMLHKKNLSLENLEYELMDTGKYELVIFL